MKKTLQIVLAAAFFAGCASTSVNSKSTSKISNEFMQNQLFEIDKIVVNGKTFDPKNAE
ncbi:META domain-containing protein, partial [Campylobacter coli]|nr:META domain-containing protein [Campylobacter coli]